MTKNGEREPKPVCPQQHANLESLRCVDPTLLKGGEIIGTYETRKWPLIYLGEVKTIEDINLRWILTQLQRRRYQLDRHFDLTHVLDVVDLEQPHGSLVDPATSKEIAVQPSRIIFNPLEEKYTLMDQAVAKIGEQAVYW